uniref:Testis expressed 2 n=1 Tax=Cyprinus carpio TaxID=7962 RepID=A0A8C2I9F2_CYPCA
MTSQGGGHADTPSPSSSSSSSSRASAARKLQVQRSLSRDTITIHFSAKGNEEEEEEEELYGLALSPSGLESEDQTVVTAQEASEELLSEGLEADMVTGLSSQTQSSALAIQHPSISLGCTSTSSLASFSWPSEQKSTALVPSTHSASSNSSPAKASGLPSKPFLSIVKSLSTEVESREVAPQPIRHRHLMKTLVKSLSTDTARSEQEASSTHRPLESRLNLHLFKPFTQTRVPAISGDSKTAPSSPLISPDSRSFFKVQEVQARIEDTKRRLSEVMCEPLQLLSKIIGEEPGGMTSTTAGVSYRSRNLSSSASELSNLSALNGHSESNNNYCIKEEEDLEGESPLEGPTVELPLHKSPSLGLNRCFMSTLARQEDEEFCELYTEDFEPCTDTELDGEEPCSSQVRRGSTEGCSEEPTEGGEEEEVEDEPPAVPHNALILLISLVYGYFVLPLPTYVCWVLMGVVAGFMLAILLVWLSARGRSSCGRHGSWSRREKWNRVPLDIKEPVIHKGWMNEIYSYDPETYHATFTHSVYVRLEGSVLRLSKPNRNIPRRATFNELKSDVTYVSQKIYDLTNSKIYLVPHSLARKRVWNKKYPICIELAKQDDFLAKVQGDKSDVVEEKTPAAGDRPEAVGTSEEPKRAHTEPVLYLFGRTGRDKEEWFRRILLASKLKSDAKKPSGLPTSCLSHSRSSSHGSLDEMFQSHPRQKDLDASVKQKVLEYNVYMAKYVSQSAGSPTTSPVQSAGSSPEIMKKFPASHEQESESEAWVNSLLGRIFWDFLGEKYWADVVSKKIQKKLSKIRLPYFMNELTLTELDMGISIPKILSSSKPSVDHRGLWFDLEISYNGSFLMTLETKMNLTRLGKEGEGLGEQGKEGYVGGHRPSKIMLFVDKIAKSKYFQKATETEFIKKKIEEVSNTPLLLTVEVQECRGTLAVNIPPPPTDRIWYGFRRPPHLELKARPKLGEREVTFAHVTDWIENKLNQEFQKIFVMPNMDDVWLPIMHSAMDTRSNANALTNEESLDPKESLEDM